MAKAKDVTKTMVRRAKATAGRVRQEANAVAAQLTERATAFADRKAVKTRVTQAKKTVARARADASALASKATAKLTGRPRNSKRKTQAKVLLAVTGAAVAAAAGVSLAGARKRAKR